MQVVNEFWSNAAGADPGDPINQSLRFRGGPYLEHTFPARLPNKINTVSVWFKLGTFVGSNDRQQLFCWRNTSSGDYSIVQWTTQSTPNYCLRFNERMGSTITTTSVYRDTGAWYHLVMQSNTRNVWINGVLQPLSGSANINNLVNTHNQMRIGAWAIDADWWDGYLADFHFIDGQALEPTTFGRYNAYDVWVPVRPQGLTFGSNGFHLDFSDPNDIGADRSPNGNNFTPTGFDTAPVGVWSSNLYSSTDSTYTEDTSALTKNFLSSYPATQGFDGDTSTATIGSGTAGESEASSG